MKISSGSINDFIPHNLHRYPYIESSTKLITTIVVRVTTETGGKVRSHIFCEGLEIRNDLYLILVWILVECQKAFSLLLEERIRGVEKDSEE